MGAHSWVVLLSGLFIGLAAGSLGGCLVTGILASAGVYKRAAEMAQEIAAPRMRHVRVLRMPRSMASRHLGRTS